MKVHKKIISILMLFLISMTLLSACSQPYEVFSLNQTVVRNENFGFWNLYQQEGTEFNDLHEQFRELLLKDFDFLTEKLRNYSPHFGVIYRHRRVDMDAHFYRRRNAIAASSLVSLSRNTSLETMPRRVADQFFVAQLWTFSSVVQIAHFMPVNQDMIRRNYFICLAYREMMTDDSFCEVFNNMSVSNFYQLELVDRTTHEANPMMQWDENNIRTEIIVPNEVAYVSFSHFLNGSPENLLLDQNILFPFYYEIQNFKHLIFDFRGNPGGVGDTFYELVVRPFIEEPLEARTHQFVRESVFNQMSNRLELLYIPNWINYSEVHPALDFVNENEMVYFNVSDLEALHYVLISQTVVKPVEVDFDFNGKIWILVDGGTASAGELAVLFAMDTGFATVVGTNTRGIMPSISASVVLPNTGIMFRFDVGYFTDAYGRSLEEFGITPNYLNRPGMDALQTVLAMIEEMNY